MTRLIFFLAVYSVGVLGTNYGGYGGYEAGDMAANAGSEYNNGQAGEVPAGAQQLSGNTGGAKEEPAKGGINIIAKHQGGRAAVQYLGEPAMPPGKTHQVRSGSSIHFVFQLLTTSLLGYSWRLGWTGIHP